MTFIQEIDKAEMIGIQTAIKLHHAALRKLLVRAQGAHLDDAVNGLDDALTGLAFADDGIQRELDQASEG